MYFAVEKKKKKKQKKKKKNKKKDYEYENELNVSAFHVSSLNKQFSFWKDTIKANNFVLNDISSGYLIPFYKTPTSVNLRNNG